ncbi:MAG: CHAT domain-containing protein, partial [Planctomycetaceae bacterium]|nr:CHAT domain-containing protein [Planctomycetaceae bacterium]
MTPTSRFPVGNEAYLSEKYFDAQTVFDQGNLIEAIQEYGDEIRRTVQSGRSRWVDSICYHARVGECHYQMGVIDSAMACFDIALQDCLDNNEWPMWLHFDSAPGVQFRAKSLPPWGDRSLSTGEMAVIPDNVTIDYMLANVTGGDLQREFMKAPDSAAMPINPTEVVVCMAVALNRRAELLGPLGTFDELNGKLVACLRRNPFPDGHWSKAWGDILLAMTLATAGNDIEAKSLLEQSLQIEGTADHPLTGFAHLELGKIAMRNADYPTAQRHFIMASHSGWHYANTFVSVEAFRNIAMTQKVISSDSNANALTKSLEWAERERKRGVQIWLNTLLAEDSVARRDLASAKTQLKRAQDLAEQYDIKHGRLAGNWNYLEAMDAYNTNNLAEGDKKLEAALERIRGCSPKCYQLTQLEKLFDSGRISVSGTISTRMGANLYGQLLREPTAFEWQMRPAESLAAVLLPRHGVYDQWFALAVAQRDARQAFDVAELAKRHRFQSTLHLGDRLMSLRFLLEAPAHLLQREHVEQRVLLLNERPELKQVSDDIRRVYGQIASLPLVTADSATQRRLDASYRELETLVAKQEAMLHLMTLEGVPAPNIFPPFVQYEEFRNRLPEGTVTLAYFETMSDIYGFFISRDQSAIWRINSPQQLKIDVSKYLAMIGQRGTTGQLEIDELSRSEWAAAGQSLFLSLLGGERTLDFTELVIVPDGFLWYLPFETLSVDVSGRRRPLVALTDRTIRYAPTAALGLPMTESRKADDETLVLLGKLSAWQDASTTRSALSRMNEQAAGLKSIAPAQVTRSPALYTKFIPQLIVLAEITPPEQGHDWVPVFGAKELPG